MRANDARRAGLLFAVAAALSAFTALRGINLHDEGLMLQAAARMSDGELPWSDFWWNYGPAQPLLLALPDWLFGPSLLPWRILRVGIDGTTAVLAWALVRRHASEPAALVAWLTVAGAMAFPKLPSPNPAVVALALAAVLAARRSPVLAGALGGVAMAFRPDLGLAAAAGAVLAAGGDAPPGARRRAVVRSAAAALAAAVVTLGPFVVAGGPGAFWDDTVGFLLHNQGLQRLPLPGSFPGGFDPNKMLEFYFPYVLLAGAAVWLASALHRRPPWTELALVPMALMGVSYLLARVDEFHQVPAAVVLAIMLAGGADRELRESERRRHAGRLALALAPAAVLAVMALHGLDRRAVPLLNPGPLTALNVDGADGVRVEPQEARPLERLVRQVDGRVPSGEPVFVANPRYDRVNVGAPLLYVLLDRENPTRYDVMQPGVVTTAAVQREMVRDLRRARPKLVVRWLSPAADQRDPNGSGRSSGVRILDAELRRSYRPVERFGYYQLLTRRVDPALSESGE